MKTQGITKTMPAGYRWATEAEVARCMHPAYFSKTIQVESGADGHTFLSLAILDTVTPI